MGRNDGLDEAKILAAADHRDSPLWSDLERRVLDYAEALTRTPAAATGAMLKALAADLGEEQLVELTASIAWENFRARFNRGFDVAAQGFSEGACCPLPQRPPASRDADA